MVSGGTYAYYVYVMYVCVVLACVVMKKIIKSSPTKADLLTAYAPVWTHILAPKSINGNWIHSVKYFVVYVPTIANILCRLWTFEFYNLLFLRSFEMCEKFNINRFPINPFIKYYYTIKLLLLLNYLQIIFNFILFRGQC